MNVGRTFSDIELAEEYGFDHDVVHSPAIFGGDMKSRYLGLPVRYVLCSARARLPQ